MKFTIAELKELATSEGASPQVINFLDGAEAHYNQEVLEAMRVLEDRGYVVSAPE